ncbi:MAG: YsnF/AvaK domain-containing protein [Pseudomonadota bacterium]
MTNTVIGVYDTFSHAQSAKQKLLASGFTNEDVRMQPSTDSIADNYSNSALDNDPRSGSSIRSQDHESHGVGDTIASFFREIFGSSSNSTDSDRYAEATRRGSFVLAVNAYDEDRRDLATSILEQFDPVDIDERASNWQASGWERYDPSAAPFSPEEIQRDRAALGTNTTNSLNASRNTDDTARTIPVIEEELEVGKRQVQRGGIRVVQRVIERPVEETIGLREEHVTIERHPVNAPANARQLEGFKEESFELREMAEEAVVSKTARVVEEVIIGKNVSETQKTISDTVRHTDVEVEQLGSGDNATRPNTVRKTDLDR